MSVVCIVLLVIAVILTIAGIIISFNSSIYDGVGFMFLGLALIIFLGAGISISYSLVITIKSMLLPSRFNSFFKFC